MYAFVNAFSDLSNERWFPLLEIWIWCFLCFCSERLFKLYCLFFRPSSGSPAPPWRHRAAETGIHGPLHKGRVHHQETGLLWCHHARYGTYHKQSNLTEKPQLAACEAVVVTTPPWRVEKYTIYTVYIIYRLWNINQTLHEMSMCTLN